MMKEPDSNANLTASLRRTHRWRMAVSGLVILVAGITLGVAGTLLVVKPSPRRAPLPPRMAAELTSRRMRDELNLTSEQVERIDTILQEHFEELKKLRDDAQPKINEVFEAMKAGIDAVLTEQQRNDWEKAMARLERVVRRGMPRGPGGRGRPGDGFRDGRGPFRGPGEPRSDDGREPGQWRRDGRRPEGEARSWRRGPDANAAPPAQELSDGQKPPEEEPEPNTL